MKQLGEIRDLLNRTNYINVTGLFEVLNTWLVGQDSIAAAEGVQLDQEEGEVEDEQKTLDNPTCPCVWGEWSEWTECSTTCGPGIIMKQREVETQATGGGAECIGHETQEQACKLLDCRKFH